MIGPFCIPLVILMVIIVMLDGLKEGYREARSRSPRRFRVTKKEIVEDMILFEIVNKE